MNTARIRISSCTIYSLLELEVLPDIWLQAVVITAASTTTGGGIGKFLGGDNVVSLSNHMTVIVCTISKQV